MNAAMSSLDCFVEWANFPFTLSKPKSEAAATNESRLGSLAHHSFMIFGALLAARRDIVYRENRGQSTLSPHSGIRTKGAGGN